MSLTPGSWWQNRRTGQKLAVADPRAMLTDEDREGRRRILHGYGREADRHPCYLQGQGLYLAWLTEDELHGAWAPLRLKPDDGVVPTWLKKPKANDFLLHYKPIAEIENLEKYQPLWVSVQRIRSGWLCLSGLTQDRVTNVLHAPNIVSKEEYLGRFNWGLQQYNTFFLPASEAVPRLRPKYDRVRTTVYDHIAQGGAIDDDSV